MAENKYEVARRELGAFLDSCGDIQASLAETSASDAMHAGGMLARLSGRSSVAFAALQRADMALTNVPGYKRKVEHYRTLALAVIDIYESVGQ